MKAARKRGGKNVGRPSKFTPEVVTKLLAAFNMSFNDTEAAVYAGISRKVLYDWLRDDPEFSDKIAAAKSEPNTKAKQLVVQSINDGDLQSAKWWLERKAYKEFNPKAVVEQDTVPTHLQSTLKLFLKTLKTQEELIAQKYRGVLFLMYEQLKQNNSKDKDGLARLDGLMRLSNSQLADHVDMEIYATHQDRAEVKWLVEHRRGLKENIKDFHEQAVLENL